MPTKTFKQEAWNTANCAQLFECLELVGCGNFPDDNTKKSVRLLSIRVQPDTLKREMSERIEYGESLLKFAKRCIKVLTQELFNCPIYAVLKPKAPQDTKLTSKDNVKPIPVSIYPPHKERGLHPLRNNCRNCPKNKKDKLLEELCHEMNKDVKRTTEISLHDIGSTVTFTVALDGKFCTTVCADIGSTATLMDSRTFEKAQMAVVEVDVVKLGSPQ